MVVVVAARLERLRGRPLEEIAAFQWATTNNIALDDLAMLPREQWTSLDYAELIAEPLRVIRDLCRFAGIDFDAGLAERLSGPLPAAKHTLTPADAEKWRTNEQAIGRVLPTLESTHARLKLLSVD